MHDGYGYYPCVGTCLDLDRVAAGPAQEKGSLWLGLPDYCCFWSNLAVTFRPSA